MTGMKVEQGAPQAPRKYPASKARIGIQNLPVQAPLGAKHW